MTDAPMLIPTNGEIWIGWTHYTKKNFHRKVVEQYKNKPRNKCY